jgi:tetratricopeptide (TPR) repeat protein
MMKSTWIQAPLLVLLLGAALGLGLAAADLDRGIQLYKDKQYEEAEKSLRVALAEEPNNDEVHFYFGVTRLELKQYKQAEQHLEIAQNTWSDARLGLAKTYLV